MTAPDRMFKTDQKQLASNGASTHVKSTQSVWMVFFELQASLDEASQKVENKDASGLPLLGQG
ncbi:MAG: hypothetical protein JKY49_09295 [Cohaesibacteraceae bacterium]|nr:hypothetical protein [Cohaesibacteraceae bacterium]MBL4875517.1 hypothetical protein [Cohaesibacteraceae bacterium]